MKYAHVRRQQQGFSLVELMVVVAIIGVLATIGIPSYRLMVQKAKKGEAKVGLGALYTSEAAFFSEYGAYGNNLEKIGFTLDGTAAQRIYAIGFPTAACADPSAVKPTAASTPGTALNSAFPGYYTGTPVYLYAAGKMPGACELGVVPDDGSTFLASANGLLPAQLAAGDANYDGWTINEQRQLRNVRDGVK